MSSYLEVMAWARDLRGLTAGEKAVLFALASRHPQIRPSIETIAGDAGLSVARCVRRILRSLEAKGLITISMGGGRNKASHYQLHLVNPDSNAGVYAPETRTETQINPDSNAAKGVRLSLPKIQEASLSEKQRKKEREGAAESRPSSPR